MRTIHRHILCTLLAIGLGAALTACKTDEPGVKSSYKSQWTTVNGNTVKATKAAKDVLEDLKLQNITSTSTSLDGHAVGYTAESSKITVSVQRESENLSQVSVQVGSMGDPELGKTIIRRIQDKLN